MLFTFGVAVPHLRTKFSVLTSREDGSVLREDRTFQDVSLLYCACQRRMNALIHLPSEKSIFDEIIRNNRCCKIFSNKFGLLCALNMQSFRRQFCCAVPPCFALNGSEFNLKHLRVSSRFKFKLKFRTQRAY
jgi:hypothetical protein